MHHNNGHRILVVKYTLFGFKCLKKAHRHSKDVHCITVKRYGVE